MGKRKVVVPAIVGNIVEYYDFGIYAVYAALIGELFFPSSSKNLQILSSFVVFAVGFLMRPIGGIVFGHIGDRFGRKMALKISIIGMAIATLCIGLLPSYGSIGIAAPTLLIIIRLFQGVCVGGESAGSAVFVLEHLEGYKPGLIGSIVMASNMVGTLLALLMGLMISQFFGDHEWSWRIGFVIGSIMGVVGLYLRSSLEETPQFKNAKNSNLTTAKPLLDAMRHKTGRLVLVMFLGGVTSAMAYTIRAYFNTFFSYNLKYTEEEAKYLTTFALINLIVFLPVFGTMADKIGYRRFLYITCYAIILTIMPIYIMIANIYHNPILVFLGLFLFSCLSAAICAPAYPYAITAFSPELRYSGVAFSWNLGIALFGGTTPAISTIIASRYGDSAPAVYLIFMCAAFIIVSYLRRKDHH